MGVKNLEVWNWVAMVKHLWTICIPANSIWSSWISSYLLHGRSIDNWHSLGLLVEFFRDKIIMDSSLGKDARLSCIIAGKELILPPPRSPKWIEVIRCAPTSFLPNDGRRDLVCWKDALRGIFFICCAWNSIRPVRDKVEWWKLVWHKHVIPWFSFILWIAIREAFST